MIQPWILAVGIVVVVLGVSYGVRNQIYELVSPGANPSDAVRPTVWWVVDDSQVNARQWLDWGNRSTREPNEPYLQLTLARARALWEPVFKVEPVVGRLAALQRLEAAGVVVPEGADRAPPALWMPYCRAAFLGRLGGLWIDGSSLPVAGGVGLRKTVGAAPAMAFGADPEEALAAASQGAEKGPAAGWTAGWAAVPGHPAWAGMEHDLGAVIAEGDQSWSAPAARRTLRSQWEKHGAGVVPVDRRAEVARDKYGRLLTFDVLFDQTEWTNGSLDGGYWVAMPGGRDGLERASAWAWFMRMSEPQIRESEFNWARWATRT
jgi:hypothetical protein